MELQSIFLKLPAGLGIIGCIYFLLNHKHFSVLGFIMGCFVAFTLFCELLAIYYANLEENNLFIVHLYTLGAFTFCSLFFQRLFRRLKADFLKNEYLLIGILLIVLNSIFIQDLTTYNSYSKTISQLIIISLCILAYSLMTLKEYDFDDKESVKIFIAAILLSCSMSTILYLFSNQILHMSQATQEGIWMINVMTNSLIQLLFIFGFYKQIAKKQ